MSIVFNGRKRGLARNRAYLGGTRVYGDEAPPGSFRIVSNNHGNLSLTEGESTSFQVWLSHKPTRPVELRFRVSGEAVVEVSESVIIIEPDDFATRRDVNVSAPDTDQHFAVQHGRLEVYSSTPGTLNTFQTFLTVTNDDVVAPHVATDRDFVALLSGGTTGIVRVRLSSAPTGTVTVIAQANAGCSVLPDNRMFTVGNWDTYQDFTITSATVTEDTDTSVVLKALESGSDSTPKTIAVRVSIDAGAKLVLRGLTLGRLRALEGYDASFTVSLSTEPVGPVVVVMRESSEDIFVDNPVLYFHSLNWNIEQTVVVNTLQDSDGTSDETAAITLTMSGADELDIATVVVDIVDNDVFTPLIVSPTSLVMDESTTRSLSVSLGGRPYGDVTVTLLIPVGVLSSAADRSVSSSDRVLLLTFTPENWDTVQTVTYTAPDVTDGSGSSIRRLFVTASGGGAAELVTVPVQINDTYVPPPRLLTTNEMVGFIEGRSTKFAMRLSARPTGTVTVAVTSDNEGVVIAVEEYLFTVNNWQTLQFIAVLSDTNTRGTVTLTPSGGDTDGNAVQVEVTVYPAGTNAPSIVATPTSVAATEGGEYETINIKLSARPPTEITLRVSENSDSIQLEGGTQALTYSQANWDRNQQVRVRAVEDENSTDSIEIVEVAASAGTVVNAPLNVIVIVVDDDRTPALVLSSNRITVTEGASTSFSVKLSARPSSSVTVSVSENDPDISLNRTSLTFTTANWSASQSIRVAGAQDSDTLDDLGVITLIGSGGGVDTSRVTVNVTILDNDG